MIPNEIIFTVFARLHITLLGLNKGGYRINGGLGFAINNPCLKIKIQSSSSFTFTDERISPLSSLEIFRIQNKVEDLISNLNLSMNISVRLNGNLPTHSGFGSSTAIRLACIEALLLLNEKQYDEKSLVIYSERGGTSGIGIRTYFKGGYIFDLGHISKDSKIVPSSIAESIDRHSLLLDNGAMPKWQLGVCIPKNIFPLSEKQESNFFQQNTPIPDLDVYETVYHTLYGLYGSIRENNKETFQTALMKVQKCKWKDLERNIYGEELKLLEEKIYKSGACAVGMSSLGPGLFFFGHNIPEIVSHLNKSYSGDGTFLTCEPINTGRLIIMQ